jgi:hypothetical protein
VRDLDVRRALRRQVLKRHEAEPDTLIIPELGLRHGVTRVDIAVVNGSMHGYEIKSDSDTLERLPGQVAVYSAVLDQATLVVAKRHVDKALEILPAWWGVKVAAEGPRGGVALRQVKRGRSNPSVNPVAVAELLWRPEVTHILRALGYPEKTLRKSRTYLYRELAGAVALDTLRDFVRRALKERGSWRRPQPPAPYDG